MSNKTLTMILLTATIVLVAGCSNEMSFKRDVMPILAENCLSCHQAGGEGFAASGFSVETYEALMRGTKLGPVINPGSHSGSTLILLLEHKGHPSINMPKNKSPLPEAQIDIIRKWIDQGSKNN